MKAGPRDQRITIQNFITATDDYGGEQQTWADFTTVWAQYVPGTGQERRQAAQESASLTASFRVLSNQKTRSVTPGGHRIVYDGANWDIVSNARLGSDARDIVATRAA